MSLLPRSHRVSRAAALALAWSSLLGGCVLFFDTQLPADPDRADGDTGGDEVGLIGADADAGEDAAAVDLPRDGDGDLVEVGDADAGDEPDEHGEGDSTDAVNGCGGEDALLWDGRAATPGEACGDCGTGVLICNGPNAVRCLGARDTNRCGGCGSLPGVPGERCGDCGEFWACDAAEDRLECIDLPRNACGGCGELAAIPLEPCSDAGSDGVWRCLDPETVGCVPVDRNACGGTAALSSPPGDPCGTCGRGVQACEPGGDAVTCRGAEAGLNACGGCAPLEAEPGEACGDCGQWQCVDGQPNVVACRTDWNACGGCAALPNLPGEECGGGNALVCATRDELLCATPGANGCGGTSDCGELRPARAAARVGRASRSASLRSRPHA